MRIGGRSIHSNGKTQRGFTLIEILMVASIISLLISVLLPALNEVRQQARSAACKSNIRQLGVGMTMYCHQYNTFPAHQWILGEEQTRVRWFQAMAKLLNGYKVQGCPSTLDWEVGRNNSYGYNYKYLGSARDNIVGPKTPFENFPVKSIRSPDRTIAFGDSDGTGWKKPHVNIGNANDVEMFGNHGYVLDPTFIPEYSLETVSGGVVEPYAWKRYRTYISTRHLGRSNLCFADGHAESMTPQQAYIDNRYWNGLGGEDPQRDPHVSYKYLDGQWRFEDIPH